MLNRLKDTLADFIQQADLVLLGLCTTATLYGIVLVFSATRYLDPSKGLRRMITQSLIRLPVRGPGPGGLRLYFLLHAGPGIHHPEVEVDSGL